MAQWAEISRHLEYMSTQTLNEIYPDTFPLDIRHYAANWIETQRWEMFDVDNVEMESQARLLLQQMMHLLHAVAQQNPNMVERVKLQHMTKNLNMFNQHPLELVRIVRDILRKERQFLTANVYAGFPPVQPMASNDSQPLQSQDSRSDVDNLVLKVLDIQNNRQELQRLQEEIEWEKQEDESGSGQNDMDQQKSDQAARKKHIEQLEYQFMNCVKKRHYLLQDAVCAIERCQSSLIYKIKSWKWEQHRANIGFHFDDSLGHLQTRCEQLVGVNGNLRQEVMLAKREHGSSPQLESIQEKLACLLQTLVQNSLLVDKQPPQVIKTQSKFSATVRYLLGEKSAPGKPLLLKAQIITDVQAKNLGQQGTLPSDNVGELINNTAILEHNTVSKITSANFRNMSIRKIKRSDRKGSESVTEEKFAILFTTEVTTTGCESSVNIQTLSLPVVVIVHGSQEINAMGTAVWDCAFSEPDRIPFVVPDRVPWKQMCEALSNKFMSEVQTQRGLDVYNLHFLAQKIFDQPDISGDFGNMPVSWAQFNKEALPGRNFTFWQWFEGVMDLTKKCLKDYWSDGLIFGFIGKQHLHVILQNKPNGTFLLRFSDSEIGGITIAYVGPSDNGGRKIQNIQPFTKKDLDSAGLGDRIRDIGCINYVYPDMPKNDAFKKFFTGPSPPNPDGYLPFTLKTVVAPDLSTSSNMGSTNDILSDLYPGPSSIPISYNNAVDSPGPSFMSDSLPVFQQSMPSNDIMELDAVHAMLFDQDS